MIIKNIQRKEIDRNDTLFFMSGFQKTAIEWKNRQEPFNPIWVQQKKNRTYRIVDGFRVFDSMQQSKAFSSLPARIFDENTETVSLWKERVEKRIVEKNYSVYDIINRLHALVRYSELNAVPRELISLLERIGVNKASISLPQIENMLEKATVFIRFCDIHSLTYREMLNLSGMNMDQLEMLNQVLGGLELKGNKLSTVLQMLDDLDIGYNLDLPTILKRPELKRILDETPIHQRYKKIKEFLYILRWPTLTKTREDWTRLLKKLDMGENITIETDPFFEADELEITIRASSYEQLVRSIEILGEKTDSEALKNLFDFI